MPATQENTTAKRGELEARIAELERMDGQPIELVQQALDAVDARRAEIAELQGQISALDMMTGASVKREREAAEQARLTERDRMRKELVQLHEQRLAALRDAEAGIRQAALTITRVLELNGRIGKLALALGAQKQSLGAALAEADFVRRLGGRIAALMTQIRTADRSRFGGIIWPAERSFYKPEENWADAEERRLAPHLEPLLKSEG